MLQLQRQCLAPLALLLGLGSAGAQNAAPAARPDPLNAQAAVPALVHTSSFAGYRRHAEAEPIGWREANDNVARIGGWRAYAREAAAGSPAPAIPAPANTGTPVAPGTVSPGSLKP